MNYIFYLLLNLLACFFLFASIMGIPGNPDENNKMQKFILNLFGYLLNIGFGGIPILAGSAFFAFLFNYNMLGQIITYLNFTIGLSMILLMVFYYTKK